jgi:hypothetical protein
VRVKKLSVGEGWVGCPLLEESLGAAGPAVTLGEEQRLVDVNEFYFPLMKFCSALRFHYKKIRYVTLHVFVCMGKQVFCMVCASVHATVFQPNSLESAISVFFFQDTFHFQIWH